MINNRFRSRFLEYAQLLIISCSLIMIIGCQEVGTRYISIHHLRIEHEKFIDREIIVRGFLSGMLSNDSGPPYLYATSDDAIMRSRSTSVFIDVYNNPRLVDISDCMGRFVEVKGRFGETNNPHLSGLGITDIHHLRIIPDSAKHGLDAYCVRPDSNEGSEEDLG